jgi:branched-chain amino acid transport system substrate-binding protein
MKKHIFIFLGVLIAFSFILPYTTFAADSYKVGAVLAVTGRASFLGDPEKKTLLMLTDEINKAGGINGKKTGDDHLRL